MTSEQSGLVWRKSRRSSYQENCVEVAFVPTWRKSSYSSTKENCVEVTLARGEVTVRDSKNPSGAALTFSQNSFGAFVSSVRSGHLG